jgi:hypothetical protein
MYDLDALRGHGRIVGELGLDRGAISYQNELEVAIQLSQCPDRARDLTVKRNSVALTRLSWLKAPRACGRPWRPDRREPE